MSKFLVGDSVRTVSETYGDDYVPVGSVGVIISSKHGEFYGVKFKDAPWPTDGGDGWSIYGRQLEAYTETVPSLVITESVSTNHFNVGGGGGWFSYTADPEKLERIAAQYSAAAEHIRNRPAVVVEPQEYGARVEVDALYSSTSTGGRRVIHRLPDIEDSRRKEGGPWLYIFDDRSWAMLPWSRFENRNPKILD